MTMIYNLFFNKTKSYGDNIPKHIRGIGIIKMIKHSYTDRDDISTYYANIIIMGDHENI
jgi:hypothetical protein